MDVHPELRRVWINLAGILPVEAGNPKKMNYEEAKKTYDTALNNHISRYVRMFYEVPNEYATRNFITI